MIRKEPNPLPKPSRLSTPIAKHLRRVKSWETATSEIRAAFREVMKGKAYGREPTVEAWHWFYCGWFKAGGVTHKIQNVVEAAGARHDNAPLDGETFP